MEAEPHTLAQQLDSPLVLLAIGTVLGLIGWLILRVIGAWDKGNELQDRQIASLNRRMNSLEGKMSFVRQHLKMERPSDAFKIIPPDEESSA